MPWTSVLSGPCGGCGQIVVPAVEQGTSFAVEPAMDLGRALVLNQKKYYAWNRKNAFKLGGQTGRLGCHVTVHVARGINSERDFVQPRLTRFALIILKGKEGNLGESDVMSQTS